MEKEWQLDLSYSAVLGIHIFSRYVFLNLMTIWLLRSSTSSQFLFPTESSFNKIAVLSYVSALFIFDLKKLVLFFIYLKNIEK